MKLYRGRVVGYQGLNLQIKIEPELSDIRDDECPFFPPFFSSSDTITRKNFFEKNSLIWLLAEENLEYGYYLGNAHLPYLENTRDIQSDINSLHESGTNNVEDLDFEVFEDGSYTYRNHKTGETARVQSSGEYSLIDKDGNTTKRIEGKKINVKGNTIDIEIDDSQKTLTIDISSGEIVVKGDRLKVETTGDILLKALGNIVLKDSTDNLVRYSELIKIIEHVEDHKHVAPTGLTGKAVTPNRISLISKIFGHKRKMKIDDILAPRG